MLIIPGAGRGSRMGTPTGGPPKCLLPVRGRPILETLVAEAVDAGMPVRVVARPGDPHLAAWANRVTLLEAPVEDYRATILRAVGDLTDFGVIDSDLVLPPGELTAFLRHAVANPSRTSLTVGVTADPLDLGPRTIWWQPSEQDSTRGGRIGRGLPAGTARLAGVYWFRPAALKALRAYDGTSFGAFLAGYPAADVDAFPLGYAFDVNTPEDLALVRARLG